MKFTKTEPEYDDHGYLVLRQKGKIVRSIPPWNLGYACDHDYTSSSDDFRCMDCGARVWYWIPADLRKAYGY